MINLIKNKSNKGIKKNLTAFFIIASLGFLLVSSLNLNILAKINNFKNLSLSAPGATVDSSDGNFRIDTWDTNDVTMAEVEDFAEVLKNAYDIIVGTWSFPDPMAAADEPPVEVTISGWPGYNGWASGPSRESNFKIGFNASYINQGFAADHEPLKVAGHEFAHLAQYAHPGSPPGKWVREGTARMIQDKLSDWLDHADGTEAGSSFVRQTQSYLSGSHTSDLTSMKYDACLFWQYYLEQFGTDHTDPDYGIDALTTYWDTGVNPTGEHGITMMNNALDVLSPGTTFEDVFKDFSVAIYAKDMDASTIPSKWTFIDDDETDGSGNYGTVSKEIDPVPTLTAMGTIADNSESIENWANKYYEVEIGPSVEVITIQFNQTTNNQLFYALLAMDGDDVEYYYTVESKDFRRAIVNINYDKIVVVVVGLENTANYKYAFEAGSPYINIESPQPAPAAAQARVGLHDEPEKFIAIVDVFYQKSMPIHGYFTENFKAQVGGINATVLVATDVYGKYFLQIQAPDQPADGLYNLKVDLVDSDNNIITSDTEEPCVNYGDTYYDVMLSIDRSGSMGDNNKIVAAKSAGKLFADSFLSDDQLGIVEFNASAKVIHDLMLLTIGNRNTAIDKIEGITDGGGTSIADGLLKSLNELLLRGIADYPDHIILLSDGAETVGPYIPSVLPYLLGNGTIVHVITIGADAAYEIMQELAADTGGTYLHAFDPSSGDIPNDLAEIYRTIIENIRHLERFYHSRGTINPGNNKVFYMDITDDMDLVEFIVHYNATMQPTSVGLKDPEKIPVSFKYMIDKFGMGYAVGRVKNPKIGKWEIEIAVSGGSSELKYFVEGAAYSSVSMTLLAPPNGIISPGWGKRKPIGTPIPVLVSLTDTKTIKDAKVYMNVIPPGYKSHGVDFRLPLYDDGNHGDSLPGDGIYGNLYTATSEQGSYQFLINATGTNNEGRTFTRIKTGAFYMFKCEYVRTQETLCIPDSDNDGLPDNWEKYYGLKHTDGTGDHGPDGDPDLDRLKNKDEFFRGTDPYNSDTDYGGQGDYSEVLYGFNPLDPADDVVEKFPPVRIYPGNKFVYMLLPNASNVAYNNLYIYRSVEPNQGFSIIYGSPYIESYNDTSVNNYVTYYYRFIADNVAFNETGLTKPYKAIPKLNILAAEANIIINNGSKSTTTNLVTVNVLISLKHETTKLANPPTHMRIGENVSELLAAPWIPFNPEFPKLLSTGEGVKFVFVQLRDDQTIPEISPVFSAGIYYTGDISVSIGLETTFTLFMITVDFAVISVIFYKKKRKHLKIKKF